MKKRPLAYITKVGILSAMAFLLMFLEVPLVFIAPPFYELDLSELPVLIGSFSLGPLAGVLIELIKNLLNAIIQGSDTAYVGELANFLMGCAFVLPASFIYRAKKTRKSALCGMIVGTLSLAVIGALVNYFALIPAYSYFLNIPLDSIIEAGTKINSTITNLPLFVILAVVPFNLIKGTLVSALTFAIYKRVSPLLKL